MTELTTTYHLQLTSPSDYQPFAPVPVGATVARCDLVVPELNHFFFTTVGRPYRWFSRLPWSYQQWRAYLARPEVHTWIGYCDQVPFGYFELEQQGSNVEVVFFGLLPSFLGRGLGGFLLNQAIEQAWKLQPKRVWVHTCNNDHPAALANYQRRGFELFEEQTEWESIPDPADPIWHTPNFYRDLPKG